MDSSSEIFWRIQEANEAMFSSQPSAPTTPFDPMSHARLSPGAFDPTSFSSNFILPRFASGGPAGAYGFGPAIVEPEVERQQHKNSYSEYQPLPRTIQPQQSLYPSRAPVTSFTPSATYDSNIPNPVYAPYGSSVVAVASQPYGSHKVESASPQPQALSPTGSNIYNPSLLGLPVPPSAGTSTNFAGLYSSSGFDVLSVLARVASRPNPTINIGPVDTSCAFLVVDARRFDYPIVFASETFSRLTGYSCEEIIGRNCRFLQSPDASTVQGTPRKYTDGNAAWHMRTHITAGKESQSSLINYMKDGKPFINLVTIVPIQWDTQEVAYYVGFQVDLVDQPNAILDRMKDGTYVVNYSLLNNPAKAMSVASAKTVEAIEEEDLWTPVEAEELIKPIPLTIDTSAFVPVDVVLEHTETEMLDKVHADGVDGLETENARKQFNKLLLDNADDFIHVLSLKGSMLYCSPSAARVLEYDPSELIGKTLPSLCHPSDVIPVMRELKDSGNVSHPVVSLLYRIRRKHSGYIWIEASGKLHVEPGKGRKCVILVGRPREVYKMSWNELRQAGGLGDSEFWTKLSPEGMVLSSATSVQNVLGFLPEEMVGTSLFQLIKPETVEIIKNALLECSRGSAVSVAYAIKSRRGYIDVVTRFYPRTSIPIEGDVNMDLDPADEGPKHLSIIAQTNEASSENRKASANFRRFAPAYRRHIDATTGLSDSGSSVGNGSHMMSTFKTLNHPSTVSDNVFDELDTTRCTSWQYELHQLQNINKKLREEKEHLIGRAHKRKSDFEKLQIGSKKMRGGSDASGSAKSGRSNKSKRALTCANCGRTDSPEWRAGPTGTKSLCNACGLRWAKTQRSSSAGSSLAGGSTVSRVSAGVSATSLCYSPSVDEAQWR